MLAAKREHADNPEEALRPTAHLNNTSLHPITSDNLLNVEINGFRMSLGSLHPTLCRANLTLCPAICLNLDVEIRKKIALDANESGCAYV